MSRLMKQHNMRNMSSMEFLNSVFDGSNTEKVSTPYELSEKDGQFLISLDLPGVNKEDIEVSIDKNELIVSGKRSQNIEENAEDENGFNVLRSTRQYGEFKRSFVLSAETPVDDITADYNNGVLELTVPKPIEKEKKTISIS